MGNGSPFTKNSPTSIINNYIKTFSKDSESTNEIFNPSQKQLGDTTDSIKRYLERMVANYPPLGGILYQDVVYDTPGVPLLFRHKLARPYKGLDVINVTAPPQFKLQAFKNSSQSVTQGTTADISWDTSSSFDPFGSLTSPTVINPPFPANCDFTITIGRSYPGSGAVTTTTPYEQFYLFNNTVGAVIGSRKRINLKTTTTTLLDDNNTVTCLDKPFLPTNTYTTKYVCNTFTQNITPQTGNFVTQLYIVENKSANPRIDELEDYSWSSEQKTIFIPILSDKACKISFVVY